MKQKRYTNSCYKDIKIILAILFLILANSICFAEEAIIKVNAKKNISQINKYIFGNNFIGYNPKTYETWHDWTNREYYGYSDYGAGIWDPKWKESIKEVIGLAKEAGITIVRFPGGCGTHHYNWKNAVGKKRNHFLYGIDEFLKTCEEIGAKSVITVSYFTDKEQDVADLVEYLKGRVRYFEIGNEVYHGDHQSIKEVFPDEYAHKYLKYYKAMKSVNPSIKIGVVLHTPDWNRNVLGIIKYKVDFGVIHTYPSPGVSQSRLEQMNPRDIFRISLGVPVVKDEHRFQEALRFLKEKSGKDVPLAVTEYNGGFVQEKPVPYRHCLGAALINEELLRIFMKPEHNILMANYWQFCNS